MATPNEGNMSAYNLSKYKYLLDADFSISNQCCNVMKKAPAHKFYRESGKTPIIATMTEESRLRQQSWLATGCNAFDSKHPSSTPMSFWTEQDVLRYIYDNHIEIASVYGDVVHDDMQLNLDGKWETKYHTTGAKRTGCIFCAFGINQDGCPNRFQMLKETHPIQYNYCINGGEYDENGVWIPNKQGLGLGHCLDFINVKY